MERSTNREQKEKAWHSLLYLMLSLSPLRCNADVTQVIYFTSTTQNKRWCYSSDVLHQYHPVQNIHYLVRRPGTRWELIAFHTREPRRSTRSHQRTNLQHLHQDQFFGHHIFNQKNWQLTTGKPIILELGGVGLFIEILPWKLFIWGGGRCWEARKGKQVEPSWIWKCNIFIHPTGRHKTGL